MLLRPFIGLLLFLSTPSARRATPSSSASFLMSIISIHALCEEGDRILWKNFKRFMGISIHALCEEGDVSQNHNNTWSKSISIHALCEEGDFWSSARFCGASVFLSTPSARRATKSCTATTKSVTNFYPRPLRGGRRIPQRLIHNDRRFLSTPSARRATQRQHHLRRRRGISIHALCEEGDRRSGCTSQLTQRFLSTPSARRATAGCFRSDGCVQNFYPRPLRGGRPVPCKCGNPVTIFLSTPSARRATVWCLSSISSSLFLSTPSARRATPVRNGFEAISELFLSTPSARRATHRTVNAFMPSTDFYPRPLRGGRRD